MRLITDTRSSGRLGAKLIKHLEGRWGLVGTQWEPRQYHHHHVIVTITGWEDEVSHCTGKACRMPCIE